MVLADADVCAGMVLGAALANEDVACNAHLAAINFDAQSFAFRFAAVLGRGRRLFVSHGFGVCLFFVLACLLG